MKRLKPFLCFAAVLGFFALTVPSNQSEAEDAYYYAHMTEQGGWPEMFHGHHLLYLPLMKLVFRGLQLAGYSGRALPVLIGFSMVSGALSVCLLAALLRRAGAKERVAWVFSAALLFSYGFWRYSTTAEIYVPAAALVLLTFYCAVRAGEHPLFFGGSVLSGTCALLIHLISLPAVLMAVPLFCFLKQGRRRAVLYFALTILSASAVYFSAARTAGLTVFTDKQVVRESLFSPRVWFKGAAASGQNLLSANFLFAFPSVTQKIESLFPSQMLQEEIFMGRLAPVWVRRTAPVTLGAAAALFVALLFFAVRKIHWTALTASGFLWLGGTSGMAFCFEPANPEMWISALVPLWFLTGLIWCAVPESRLARWLPGSLAVALLLHNWAGGISLVKNPDGDYCRQKSAWIMEQSRPGDLIVSADSHSFVTFLEYQTRSRVMDAKFINLAQWNGLKRQTAGRIFIFSDVVELLPPVARRAPDAVRQIHEVAALFQEELHPVHSGPFGVVYQWGNR